MSKKNKLAILVIFSVLNGDKPIDFKEMQQLNISYKSITFCILIEEK